MFDRLSKPRLLALIFFASLFFLTVGASNSRYKIQAVILPWILLAADSSARSAAKELLQRLKTFSILSFSFATWLFLSSLINAGTIKDYTLMVTAVLWFPVASITLSLLRYRRVPSTRAVAMTLCSAISLILFALFFQKYRINLDRPYGMGHNVLTGPILCILGTAAYIYQKRFALLINQKYPAILGLIFLSLALLGAFLTGSRTAILCIFAIILIVPWRRKKLSKSGLILFSSAVLASLFFIRNRISEAFNDVHLLLQSGFAYSSIGSRFEAFSWGWNNIPHSWLFGYSAEALSTLFNSRYRKGEKIVELLPHLHNDFLQLTVAYGVASSVLFTVMLLYLFRVSGVYSPPQTHVDDHKNTLLIKRGLRYMLYCIIIASCFDSITYNTEVFAVIQATLGVLIGLMMCTAGARHEDATQDGTSFLRIKFGRFR